jgi:DNA (cytosine-5)-methyltransferase 1
VGHADHAGLERRGRPLSGGGDQWPAGATGAPLGDPDGERRLPTIGGLPPAARPFPPSPAAAGEWAAVLTADPTLEPAIRGVADGLAHRVERLRLAGNGVVPMAAAAAFMALAARIE